MWGSNPDRSKTCRPSGRPKQFPIPLVPELFITRKLVGSEVGHSPPPSPKAKNEWRYTPRSSLHLHGVCKYRFNFSVCLMTVRREGLILIIYRISHYLFVPYICYWLELASLFIRCKLCTLVSTSRVCTDLLRANLIFVYNSGTVRCGVMYYVY